MKDTRLNATNTLLKKMSLLLIVFFVSGCHPPVHNYLDQSQRNTQTWIGAPAAELVLVKGTPRTITYLGQDVRAAVTSEYWTKQMDRFSNLKRSYGPESLPLFESDQLTAVQVYKKLNTLGPWLYSYKHPVRDYRSQIRYCTEFYVVGRNATVVESGFVTTNINDLKHCPSPVARPSSIIAANKSFIH